MEKRKGPKDAASCSASPGPFSSDPARLGRDSTGLRGRDGSLSRRRYFVATVGVAGEVAGAGCAGEAAGTVVGVMVTPVTFPLMASFCFLLVVPRASRVAFALAADAAFCAAVRGATTFRGCRP